MMLALAKRFRRLALMLPVCLAPPLASAEETALWKSMPHWDVRVDMTLANSCFAMAGYEGGTWLRIGFNMLSKTFYLFLGDEDWTSLERGKEYDLEIQFGKKSPWDVTATGRPVGDSTFIFLYAESTKTDFLDEFMTQHNMRVAYQGSEIANLSLKGSYAAFMEVLNCQQAMTEGDTNRNRSDPFEGSEPENDDPFAY